MKQVKIKLPLRSLAIAGSLFLSATAFAQSGTVKGQVKDASGEPVIGATITANGKPIGVTDFDGNYTIKVPKGTQLTISYVGMTPQKVTAADNLVVTLKDDTKLLNDVVVIGYGKTKKSDLTGSVTAIKPDQLSKGITNNATDMMVGKIAGVDVVTAGGTPGAGAQIRVRGGSSLNASNDPLLVIDGLTIDNNTATGMTNVLAMINPNDIESFTVLKDASATAIYGSRASNGVIIITTKKGRNGQKPTVSYNGDVTISTIAKKYNPLNAADYKALCQNLGLDVSKLGNADTDWQDQIFRTSVSTNHSVSVQGGLKNMPYRVSVGYNTSNGIVKTSWMNRFNTSFNISPSFLDNHLNLNITGKYMHEKNRYADASGAIGSALSIDPTRPVYVDSSDPTYDTFGGYYQPYQNAPSTFNSAWKYTNNPNAPQNPLALLEMKRTMAYANDLSGNIEVDYKLHGFEDLHIHGSLGAQYTKTRQTDDIDNHSYSNNYYGWSGETHYRKYNIVGNIYAQYQHKFGVNDIDVMGGAEQSHYHRNGYNEGQGTDPYTGAAYSPSIRSEQEWATHNSLVSYFGRANYTLMDRYMITATFRADGSSRFDSKNKWGYFPSAAFAWKINNEKFLKNVSWLDELKLRLGWGITGQQDITGDFLYTPLYTQGNSYAMVQFGQGGNSFVYTTRPSSYNTNLKWEQTTTWNGGLDFSVLNGRITWSFDGYYRKTKDLINSVVIPVETNFGDVLTKNIGSLKNYGIEFAVSAKPIVTKNFTWDVTYNIAWNHNEITSLTGSESGDDSYYVSTGETISRGSGTTIMANRVGEAASSFFVYQQVYDKNGKPIEGMYVDRNGDGKINASDRYFYKKPAPDVTMGFTTKFLYKEWDLSASFHASLGNYVYYNYLSDNGSISASGIYSNSAFRNTFPEAVELGFTGLGTEYWLSDYFVRNASYLKCSNITLGYSFPALLKFAGKEMMSGRIFFTVQNPFIITKYKGLDPEVASGVDKNPYPRPRCFQIGLSLNF